MIPVRYLKVVKLYKKTQTRKPNGAITESYTLTNTYYAQAEEITDQVSVSLYGATVNKMLRFTTPRNELESYLNERLVSQSDNVTDYVLVMDNKKYRISVTKLHWVDAELVGAYTTVIPSL